jgi:hypothetical protein
MVLVRVAGTGELRPGIRQRKGTFTLAQISHGWIDAYGTRGASYDDDATGSSSLGTRSNARPQGCSKHPKFDKILEAF